MTMRLLLLLLLLLGFLTNSVLALRRPRLLQETLSTTKCDNVRRSAFPARLDLYYFYLIEFEQDDVIDLKKIDRAIASSLVQVFKDCDEEDQPKYAIFLNPKGHEFQSQQGKNE